MRRSIGRGWFRGWLVAACVATVARAASAQDYSVTQVWDQYETPPAGVTDLAWGADGYASYGSWVDLPFDFPYFGVLYDRVWFCKFGFAQLGKAIGWTSPDDGEFPQPSDSNGVLAVKWDWLRTLSSSRMYSWVAGEAPNRRAVLAWVGLQPGYGITGRVVSFELVLYEGSGRIVFAHAPAVTGDGWNDFNGYTEGIDSPTDSRWVVPRWNVDNINGHPGSDLQFDPRTTQCTGRVLYDRLVADATGIGGSVQSAVAPVGLVVELRKAAARIAAAPVDADGDFTLKVCAAASGATGDLALVARSAACQVRPDGVSAPYSVQVASAVSLAADAAVGTFTFGASGDAQGAARAPLHVAQTLTSAHAWVSARVATDVPAVDVHWDTVAGVATGWTAAAAGAPAVIRISGSGSGNEDAWDADVVRKVYGRHVLAALAAVPSTSADGRFDVETDPANAFAEAFGYFLAAAISGDGEFVDAIDADEATVLDVEDPQPTSPRSAATTAWVASMLQDLGDGANEQHDRIDGLGAAVARPLLTLDSLSAAPDVDSFLSAWIAAGYDAPGILRSYIWHGFVLDDAREPNDDGGEPTPLGAAGVREAGLVLNPWNEDWFSTVLSQGGEVLNADLVFDRGSISAQATLQVTDTAGNVLASASTGPGYGPVRCSTAPLPSGTYHLRVVHDGGERIPSYSVQAHRTMRMDQGPLPDWTVGRPYLASVPPDGGVPPLSLLPLGGPMGVPGISVDWVRFQVRGTPTAAGSYSVSLLAEDSGAPKNSTAAMRPFRVNDEVRLHLGDVVAFPLGRALRRGPVGTGGTSPFVVTLSDGTLPEGIAWEREPVRLLGTAVAEETTRVRIEATDVAGSTDAAEVTAVVCVPPDEAAHAGAGAASCGFFFDAVAGSSVALGVKTPKGSAKRAWHGIVLGTDGTTPQGGVKAKDGTGKFTASRIACAETGRYYVVLASPAGEATALELAAKIVLPRAGKGQAEDLDPDDRVDVAFGALAGARLVLKVAPVRGTAVQVLALIAPDGSYVPVAAGEVVEKGSRIVLTKDLAASGTWRVRLSSKQAEGGFRWSYKLTQPKGAAYADD